MGAACIDANEGKNKDEKNKNTSKRPGLQRQMLITWTNQTALALTAGRKSAWRSMHTFAPTLHLAPGLKKATANWPGFRPWCLCLSAALDMLSG